MQEEVEQRMGYTVLLCFCLFKTSSLPTTCAPR